MADETANVSKKEQLVIHMTQYAKLEIEKLEIK